MTTHRPSRMRMAHGDPYVSIEMTSDAEPTITTPPRHSRTTRPSRIDDVWTRRIVVTQPARPPGAGRPWRAGDGAAIVIAVPPARWRAGPEVPGRTGPRDHARRRG